MENLTLFAYPDVPKTPVALVKDFDKALTETLNTLAYALQTFGIESLAASHIKHNQAIIALYDNHNLNDVMFLINPQITESKGQQSVNSECLFFPGMATQVKRPMQVTVNYRTPSNEAATLTATGPQAAHLCYLIDCLQGKLVTDHMSSIKKKLFLEKYKKQMAQGFGCGDSCGHDHH